MPVNRTRTETLNRIVAVATRIPCREERVFQGKRAFNSKERTARSALLILERVYNAPSMAPLYAA